MKVETVNTNNKTTEFFSARTNDKLFIEMSNELFSQWRGFIYEKTGIYFQDNKKYLLESRLMKRLLHLKMNSYQDYLNFIRNTAQGNYELRYLYDAITINETFFFRNQAQLDALVLKVIPELISEKRNSNQNKIKIWSAAVSSGEEAYSIAMMINDFVAQKYPDFEFELLGTDISNTALEAAVKGVYGEYSIRNVPIQFLKRYFRKTDNYYEISPIIKGMVDFRYLNLYEDIGIIGLGNVDVIFCANVLIYFDQNSKIKVINNLYRTLNKNGYLFIGYSESLHGISKAFKLVSFPKTVGYKKE
ncbi:Chemotaxis protein methyltransferase CheR [Ignavibacterium album JCM 16511]|uniref:protein-glutamate O-methyltransferase n=1 Tax=Ignavibacterium album (strain DSM 19864 / JCM 16511 / NBRC 101810 / Mat9-16) TaxID=945713 RepID=I0AMQ0_IGNAJ|nr:protein-glutamate O-methyltransferase CheR [Ignavibacterium album]AFH50257.1 Chemotaxis protein methyltransferase CheR [Ignavibacterium album JCM 16511]